MKRIRTEHFIPFPPAAVWRVLTDFDSFEQWNPLNIRARGAAGPGARIRMTFINPARPGTTVDQTVTVSVFEPPRRLAWRGHVPLLFSGEHVFELVPEGDGTRLLHGETMSGLIAMTFTPQMLARDFVPAYEAMNRALAARVARLGLE